MKVEVSLGEVVDKVTILNLKDQHMTDASALTNVRTERRTLLDAWAAEGLPPMDGLADWAGLQEVNGKLWAVEDELREHERHGDFGDDFVRRARAVYHLNDERARLKRSINKALGSRLVEEKSYADYSTKDVE